MKKPLACALILCLAISHALAQSAQPPIGTQKTAFFNGTQSITRTIPALTGKSIYITQMTVTGSATAVFTLITGTGTNCGTNPVVIYTTTIIAGEDVDHGNGGGVVAVVGTGVDLCITIATASANGWLSYAQF